MADKMTTVVRTAVHRVGPEIEAVLFTKNRSRQVFVQGLIGIQAKNIVVGSQLHGEVFLTYIAPEFFLVNDSPQATGNFYRLIGRVGIQDDDLISDCSD